MLWRITELQIINKDFYRDHGDARSLRIVSIPTHRGIINDRNGEPLAISTPVDSIWANPEKVLSGNEDISKLAELLDTEDEQLTSYLKTRITRKFVYLKRQAPPELAAAVSLLDLSGVYLQREYKRYYPAGEVAAHLVGFTNVDDTGQEGIELAYDEWLQGIPGSKRVLKDRLGRIVQDIESIEIPRKGKQLTLSIDLGVQYLAYRELKNAVTLHKARSGTVVMMNCDTGEVLAMAAQPSYNPNNRSGLKSEHYRNRVVTDVFEPGSTLKPFTVAAGLMSGIYTPNSRINTKPGYLKVVDHTIRDIKNYGEINLSSVIGKSSNVGASKIALSLGPERLWDLYTDVGLGQSTGSGFPGESSGLMNDYQNWSEVELATIAFGHGLAVTTLQLAQAYSVIANGGLLIPATFQKTEAHADTKRVLPANIAEQVKNMLVTVVQEGGTGLKAAVKGYKIAGKTGTAHKAAAGGYAEDQYLSLFAGMAPASNPKLVLIVVIDEPSGGEHFGGQVAAPVFARIMEGSLRILNIPPDDLPSLDSHVLVAGSDYLNLQGVR